MIQLPLDQIRMDGGTQSRAQLDWVAIDEYAASMQEGEQFPPVIVYYDGSNYWLADGFHRTTAAQKAGLAEIGADVRQGTCRDAVLHSVGANAQHGVRRTNRDKRQAVTMLLNDEEWRKLSDDNIARLCGVSKGLVWNIRNELINKNLINPSPERFGLLNGKLYSKNVANLGRKPVQIPVPEAEGVEDGYSIIEPESEIKISIHDTEFTYRIAPDNPCLIERSPNRDSASWYWYLRRDTAIETEAAFLQLSKSMGLLIPNDTLPPASEELSYDEYDTGEYDTDEYDTDEYDTDEYDTDNKEIDEAIIDDVLLTANNVRSTVYNHL